ncbi:MAG: hypothetical protein H0T99_13930 [Geodermatophilaceae bacterium]|nr:hypothetical protein [Geodermatophilaceae bacterium]
MSATADLTVAVWGFFVAAAFAAGLVGGLFFAGGPVGRTDPVPLWLLLAAGLVTRADFPVDFSAAFFGTRLGVDVVAVEAAFRAGVLVAGFLVAGVFVAGVFVAGFFVAGDFVADVAFLAGAACLAGAFFAAATRAHSIIWVNPPRMLSSAARGVPP